MRGSRVFYVTTTNTSLTISTLAYLLTLRWSGTSSALLVVLVAAGGPPPPAGELLTTIIGQPSSMMETTVEAMGLAKKNDLTPTLTPCPSARLNWCDASAVMAM